MRCYLARQTYTYKILKGLISRGTDLVIVTPHGGGIEPGTTEIVRALAGADLSYYLFQGLKPNDNLAALHITSSNFDEPQCVALLRAAAMTVAVHGESSALRWCILEDFIRKRKTSCEPHWKRKTLSFTNITKNTCKAVTQGIYAILKGLAVVFSWS